MLYTKGVNLMSNNARRKKRSRFRTERVILAAMMGLLLVVSVSAVSFIVILFFNDMLPTSVFATGERAPAWLGELPADAPVIGENVNSNDMNFDTVNIDETAPPLADSPHTAINPDISPFSVIPFYIASNADYYIEFQERNPHFNAETVVWKVNAFLHLPFYSHIQIVHDPNPLLVNPFHRLPYGFEPASLVPVYGGNPELRATPETAAAFARMRESANRAGFDLAVVSAYRTAARQRVLFDRQGSDGVVARPYHSEHQTGRALDLWGPTPSGLLDSTGPPTPTGIWVAENAHRYGFIIRYTPYNTHITGFISEPWHITYVGTEIAQNIRRNNLSSLEEFVARNPNARLP